MSELVKMNLIKKLEEMGIIYHAIISIKEDKNRGVYDVKDAMGKLIFCLTKEAYEELDKF